MNRFTFTKKQLIFTGSVFVVLVIVAIVMGVMSTAGPNSSKIKNLSDSEKMIEILKNDSITNSMELTPQFVGYIQKEGSWYKTTVTFNSRSGASINYTIIFLKDASGEFSIGAGLGDSFDTESLARKGIPKSMIDGITPAQSGKEIDE